MRYSMGYKLCTAEKPSVAREIARVVGANEKKHGYYEGNGFIVTWAVGHLVGLAEPEDYGYVSKKDMWSKEQPNKKIEAYDELPLIPSKFKTIVLGETKEQFVVMKELMHRDDVEYIIDCGDMGAEGHILQWLIREKAGNKKPVKRFCATSLTDEAVKSSMENLRDINEFKNVILGEFCKKRADWILGMSMSRCASIKYSARVDVGRVQSPTLFFIIKRFMEVNAFKATDYYTLKAEFKEGFAAYWKKDTGSHYASGDKDTSNRLLNKGLAEAAAKEIGLAGVGTITEMELKRKAIDRPQLYDITELQRDGNRIYGYTASEVLQAAQSLYEVHKVTSYPRTDSRYITSDLRSYMDIRIKQIASLLPYEAIAKELLEAGLNIDKKIIDDSKVTDHHAIIVTEKIDKFDQTKLSEMEQNILHLIITRMLVSFCSKYTYDETILRVQFKNGMTFSASGNKPVSIGWKKVQEKLMGKEIAESDDNHETEENQVFPNVQKGQTVSIRDISVSPKKTTPPKLHTEATLLTAMEHAGDTLSNGKILKGKGIGTQATRAAIIKSLFDKKYITNKQSGKTKFLIPTKQGISVIKVLPADMYSPKITADWEERIAQIIKGDLTEADFMNELAIFIKSKVNEVKISDIKEVSFSQDKEEFAKCPWCGASIYKGQIADKETNKKLDSYYCANKCGFSLLKDDKCFLSRTGKRLSSAQIKALIKNGSISTTCLNKNNATYIGEFCLVKNSNGYAALDFRFPDKKKSKKG